MPAWERRSRGSERGASLTVATAGRGGVPAAGVAAVVVNVTGVKASASTFVTAWPSGSVRPVASNLNLSVGATAPNLVVVKLGPDGAFRLFNSAGSVDLLADVVGWAPATSEYHPLAPSRIVDTRSAVGTPRAPIGAGATLTFTAAGRGGVPISGVGAVVVNVTGIRPTLGTFLTAWPAGTARPAASTLNLTAGITRPNLAVLKVGSAGQVSVFNSAGVLDIAVDVVGWFPDGGQSSVSYAVTPGTVVLGSADVVSVTPSVSDPSSGTVLLGASSPVPLAGGRLVVAPGPATATPAISGLVTGVATLADGTVRVTYARTTIPALFTALEVHEPQRPIGSAGTARVVSARRTSGTAAAECTAGGEQVVKPIFSLSGFDGAADYSLADRSALVLLHGEIRVGWSFSATAAYSCTYTLATMKLGAIGPVVPELSLEVVVSVSGAITAGEAVQVPITVGFSAQGTTVVSRNRADVIGETNDSGTITGTASVALNAGVALKLFGVLGVKGTIGPKADLSFTGTATGTCVELDGSIVISLEAVVGAWLAEWTWTMADFTLGTKRLWASSSCGYGHWSGTVQVQATTTVACSGCGTTGYGDQQVTTLVLDGGDPENPDLDTDTDWALVTGTASSWQTAECTEGHLRWDHQAAFSGQRRRMVSLIKDGVSGWRLATNFLGVSPIENGDSGVASGTDSWSGPDACLGTGSQPINPSYYFSAWPVHGNNFVNDWLPMPDTNADPSRLVGTASRQGSDVVGAKTTTTSITFAYDLTWTTH